MLTKSGPAKMKFGQSKAEWFWNDCCWTYKISFHLVCSKWFGK